MLSSEIINQWRNFESTVLLFKRWKFSERSAVRFNPLSRLAKAAVVRLLTSQTSRCEAEEKAVVRRGCRKVKQFDESRRGGPIFGSVMRFKSKALRSNRVSISWYLPLSSMVLCFLHYCDLKINSARKKWNFLIRSSRDAIKVYRIVPYSSGSRLAYP